VGSLDAAGERRGARSANPDRARAHARRKAIGTVAIAEVTSDRSKPSHSSSEDGRRIALTLKSSRRPRRTAMHRAFLREGDSVHQDDDEAANRERNGDGADSGSNVPNQVR
jgi:hypothetical protein